jgi:hypothetical protein
MDPIRLVHIAPELPPTVGGVADYTAILSRRLVEVSDGTVEPVLVHAGNEKADEIDVEFPVTDLSGQCSATTLADTVERLAGEARGKAVVLLEYSGYGYARRGAPLWLARGLGRVCGEVSIPLLTMFHEISASGPLWSTAFWLSPVQTHVARRLARLSNGLMTTHPTGDDKLRAFVGENTPVRVRPVFSNVGEPASRPAFGERAAQAVVFGGSQTKAALYDTHRATTRAALSKWEIDRVVDVGPPETALPKALDVDVDVQGLRPAETISNLLLNARIGLLHYPAAYATKSGILAAYLAHGVVPVLVAPEPLGGRLEAGTHFAVAAQEGTADGPWIARAAAAWYNRHAHSRRAAQTALTLMKQVADMSIAPPTSRCA